MPITPDTKDWTWVLERPCPECGFDPGAVDYRDVPELARQAVEAWREILADRSGGELTARPNDSTWSALEYAAHARDVFRIMHSRLGLMLVIDDPDFLNWDQDATAEERDYNRQPPERVSRELTAAGRAIAEAFELVPDADLGRTGRRSDGSRFTVETLARYFTHDVVHHLWDVTGARFGAAEGDADGDADGPGNLRPSARS